MNANAYGGELGRVLEWVDICTARGPERRGPGELGFAYRRSNLRPGEVVARASFRLSEGDVAEIKATLARMRDQRRDAQPSGIKTFGSTFKNPDDNARAEGRTAGQLLEAAGCRGLQVGAVMAEGRRRVRDRFGVVLEPEVQVLGTVAWPDAGLESDG